MNLGKVLDYMDETYHHRNHRPLGWVFCDLKDYYYGMSARALLREEYHRDKPLRVPLLACALLVFKLSNSRIKWGDPLPRTPEASEVDESDTTVEEFDAMWEGGEPVETMGRNELYDWVDDETLGYEETMKIFDALGPEETVGPPTEDGVI